MTDRTYPLTPLAQAALAYLLAAQDAERARVALLPKPDDGIAGVTEKSADAEPQPPLTAEEIVALATERGLAELVHLTSMPAAQSQQIPLNWERPRLGLDHIGLSPSTGPTHAMRAVRRMVPTAPKR